VSTRLLLVEDDLALAGSVRAYLEPFGFQTILEPRGDQAVESVARHAPQLVILDVMLPGLDGFAVCRELRREYRGPILLLTALSEDVDQVAGLEAGADDYLSKPVKPRVLLARIRAALRRGGAVATGTLTAGPIRIEPASRTAWCADRELELSTTEFELLAYLVRRAGTVVSREELYRELRGIEYDGLDRSMDLRISRLRTKLEDDHKAPRRLKSVRGAGYLLVASE
jgi:two-component system response regulator RstA